MGSSRANLGVMGLCALTLGMMMILMARGVAGQGPAAAPVAEDCTSVLVALVDCLPYAMGNVSAPPPATCCTNLSSVIDNSPQCLCQLYNNTFAGPFGVNITDALQLPSACKLTTPDPSLCSAFGIPVPGPTASVPAAATSPGGVLAPAPVAEDCTSVLVGLVDCLPFAMGNVSTPPPKTCCTNLSSVIDNDPQCLCQLYNTTFAGPFGVNITDAVQLPSACKLTTPDPSLCAAFGIPVPGPTVSVPASAMSPGGSAVPPTSSTTPSTTAASPPINPNIAPSIADRGLAAASSLLFVLVLLFH